LIHSTRQKTGLSEKTIHETNPVTTAGINSLNEGSTAAFRYVLNGNDYTLAFVSLSVTNTSPTPSLTGTVNILDYNNNIVATASVPSIPPLGAVGYLLVAQNPTDTLGLFPSSLVLSPAGPEGAFHGTLRATFSGPAIFLAQEFIGASMANLVIEP
jgi:hypothetical protein